MHSAYDTDVEYSNYTQTFSGLLDYIYFTDDFIELIQVIVQLIIEVRQIYIIFLFLGIIYAIS